MFTKLIYNFSYLRFSAISSQLVREALKKEFRTEAPKKSTIKQTLWKDGKPMSKFIFCMELSSNQKGDQVQLILFLKQKN